MWGGIAVAAFLFVWFGFQIGLATDCHRKGGTYLPHEMVCVRSMERIR